IGPVVTNTSLVFNTSGTITQLGAISGNGSVTKTGSGTLLYTVSNTYAGGTNVVQGSLKLSAPVIPVTLQLQEWFDAANSPPAATPGGNVTAWTDATGNGRDLSAQGTPTYVANAINGRPVVHFDGNSRLTNTYDSGNPYTILSVMRMQGTENQ